MGTLSNWDTELDTTFTTKEFEAEVMNLPKHTKSSEETKELYAKLHEQNVDNGKQFHWEQQVELAKLRQGRVIHILEFLRLLRTIIPAQLTGVSKAGLVKLEVGIATNRGLEYVFACGINGGSMHEYSTMYFDAYGLPTSEMYRGWRTVLLRLIISGYISEEQANKVFGEATGPEARRYKEQLFFYRNR